MSDDAPITPRRAETQARLLDAAAEIFAERGVLAATVEEICDRAGYSRGAFYSNFASKDELVLALLSADHVSNIAGVSRLLSDSVLSSIMGTREEAIEMAATLWMQGRQTDRHWILMQQEIRLYAAREPVIRDAYLAFRRAFQTDVLAAMRPVIESYGLVLSMPEESAVEILTAVYDSCVANGLLHLTPEENDIKNLDPAVLDQILAPMRVLLNAWILDVRLPDSGAER